MNNLMQSFDIELPAQTTIYNPEEKQEIYIPEGDGKRLVVITGACWTDLPATKLSKETIGLALEVLDITDEKHFIIQRFFDLNRYYIKMKDKDSKVCQFLRATSETGTDTRFDYLSLVTNLKKLQGVPMYVDIAIKTSEKGNRYIQPEGFERVEDFAIMEVEPGGLLRGLVEKEIYKPHIFTKDTLLTQLYAQTLANIEESFAFLIPENVIKTDEKNQWVKDENGNPVVLGEDYFTKFKNITKNKIEQGVIKVTNRKVGNTNQSLKIGYIKPADGTTAEDYVDLQEKFLQYGLKPLTLEHLEGFKNLKGDEVKNYYNSLIQELSAPLLK